MVLLDPRLESCTAPADVDVVGGVLQAIFDEQSAAFAAAHYERTLAGD